MFRDSQPTDVTQHTKVFHTAHLASSDWYVCGMAQLLSQLLDTLFTIPQNEWPKTAVVFPSRRAGVAFRKLLAANIEKPVFPPAILTLPDWIALETGWRAAEPLDLQFSLYEAYLEMVPDEPLESFLHWAPDVLADFSEVDAYLLDANRVFGYLSQEKAIDLWSPDTGQLGQVATNFLDFYRRLGSLYHRLREKQLEKGTAWQSMMSRQLAEQLQANAHQPGFAHCLFAGFNALNPAEEAVFEQYIRQFGARAFFEADGYYLKEEHEAGLFLLPYLEHPLFKRDLLLNGRLSTGDSRISVVETLGWSAQLQHVHEQISRWMAAGVAPEDCVVVLADEQMLVPLLAALPNNLPTINVTLGYPFTESHAYSWLLVWLDLLERTAENRIHTRYLLPIVRHPMLRGKSAQSIEREMLKSGKMWLSRAEASELLKGLMPFWQEDWFQTYAQPSDWMAAWERMFRELLSEKDGLQHAMGLQAITLLRRLGIQLKQFDELNQWSLFRQLLLQSTKREQVAFLGEPLAGLQIMGLLETRGLAFSHVLVVGLNEGKLPLSSRQDGFITYSLRREFGLPGPREKEAVFAYHFYRLLQHAQETVLLCSNQVDDLGRGEPSRYIAQLELEWPGVAHGNFSRQQLVPSQAETENTSVDIRIEKGPEVLERLEEIINRTISPSALQDLVSCKLKFYFKRVLSVKPPKSPTDALEVNELGTLLHGTLEQLYQPYVGELLSVELLQRLQDQAPVVLRQWVAANYKERDFSSGINVLMLAVCDDYLQRYFEAEKALVAEKELYILEQEKLWEARLAFGPRQIQLGGYVDRVDRLAGTTRIIDYKTGNFEEKEIKLADAADLLLPEKAKALQLLAYVWLYKQQVPTPADWPEAGILSFRKLNSGMNNLKLEGDVSLEDALNWFEQAVAQLLSDLMDTEQPIVQTEDLDQCAKCDFRSICNR